MKSEIVFENGYTHREYLSDYNGVGSNQKVDMQGNKYKYDHMLNRWERKTEETK